MRDKILLLLTILHIKNAIAKIATTNAQNQNKGSILPPHYKKTIFTKVLNSS